MTDDLLQDTFQNLLIVEDHPLFSEGFEQAIRRLFPQAALQVSASGIAARDLLLQEEFDLVFLDLNLPQLSGFAILEELQTQGISQPILIITADPDAMILHRARRFGALGVLSKRIDLARLTDLCRRLARGETLFDLERPRPQSEPVEVRPELSGRELDVLLKLAEGLENNEICSQLGISISTLRTHLCGLFQKMQVSNRTACVVKAIRLGWI